MNIKFPIEPYQIQTDFAKTLYEALESQVKLCFMESPTGTGKSYSLLVGLCSWLQKNRFNISRKQQKTSSMPSWIKKASSVVQEGEMMNQQNRLKQKLRKINSNDITTFKIKNIGTKVNKEDKKEEKYQEDQQFIEQEENIKDNGKRNIFLKVLQQQQKKFNRPRVIFTSRTHSQLSQIVKSFTKLQTNLICLSLASKTHMCINAKIKNSADIDNHCTKLLQKGGCSFYCKEAYKQFFNTTVNEAVQLGEKYAVCPYYGQKNLLDVADIICVPYSSILRKSIRDRLGISLRNCIVVFDEGHNIVEFDLNSLSTELKYKSLCSLNARISDYQSKHGDRIKYQSKFLFGRLQKIITDLLSLIKLKYESKSQKQTYSKSTLTDFLLELCSSEIQIHRIKNFIQMNNLSNRLYFTKADNQNSREYEADTLLKLINFLETVIFDSNENSIVIFKHSHTLNETVIKTIVFQAASVKEVVQLSKMTIFAGGTLHPLTQLEELKSPAISVVSKEYGHVIPKENCQVYIIQAFNNLKLQFTYKNKEDEIYLNVVKGLVKKIHNKQKEGIIVFLQSYRYLDVIRNYLKKQQFYENCFFDQKQNNKLFERYQKAIQHKKPAILFSVMGGRLSEGINFSDELARALLIFGLPYSDPYAPEIGQRMAYYDKQGKNLTGKQYYENLCMKIVNQTIGRAIRHQKDWAKIYLIDERFTKNIGKLSKWLRNRCNVVTDESIF